MSKWRILAVDDDPQSRRLITMALSEQYEVVEASDGLDALAKLERGEPDFIILDVEMPLLDGYKTCEAIRRHPKYKDLTVLFLSGHSQTDQIKKGYESGASLYLTKPITPSRLLKNVDLYFEKLSSSPPKKTYTLDELEQLEAELGKPAAAPTEPQEPTAKAKAPEAPAPPESPEIRPTPPQPETEQARPRILIIDDDPQIIKVLYVGLKGQYEVLCATDGVSAISKIANYQPDILLLDVMMPKFSGYQLLQTMRRNPKFRDTIVVLCSAKGSQRDIDYAKKLGADDYIVKPFELSTVELVLQRIVESPGFSILPKRYSYEEALDFEGMRREAPIPKEDVAFEDLRQLRKTEHELKQFIDTHFREEEEEGKKKKKKKK